ncbi:hypothetical protein J6590_073484 [Homalodisca vitripennis]|nr:hypothetical protein J6590_073484 [Homalodisca vitripennis]
MQETLMKVDLGKTKTPYLRRGTRGGGSSAPDGRGEEVIHLPDHPCRGGQRSCCYRQGTLQEDVAIIITFTEATISKRGYRGCVSAERLNTACAAYKLQSDRVGHGYHVVQDEKLYARCRRDRIHFECCPYSSFLTAAVPPNCAKHPILRFAEDGVNFSLSSDDPTLTGNYVDGDYKLARSFGLTDQHLAQANLNAAKAAFLPESEKKELIKEICKSYGLEDK